MTICCTTVGGGYGGEGGGWGGGENGGEGEVVSRKKIEQALLAHSTRRSISTVIRGVSVNGFSVCPSLFSVLCLSVTFFFKFPNANIIAIRRAKKLKFEI